MKKPYFLPIFSALLLLHVTLILLMSTKWAVHAVWFTNLVSATLFLPLLVFKSVGLPVFGHSEGFGWATFTMLGWLLLCVFWMMVYWGIATFANRLLFKLKPPFKQNA